MIYVKYELNIYIMYVIFSIQTVELVCDVSKKQLHYFSKIYLENNQKADTLLGIQWRQMKYTTTYEIIISA